VVLHTLHNDVLRILKLRCLNYTSAPKNSEFRLKLLRVYVTYKSGLIAIQILILKTSLLKLLQNLVTSIKEGAY